MVHTRQKIQVYILSHLASQSGTGWPFNPPQLVSSYSRLAGGSGALALISGAAMGGVHRSGTAWPAECPRCRSGAPIASRADWPGCARARGHIRQTRKNAPLGASFHFLAAGSTSPSPPCARPASSASTQCDDWLPRRAPQWHPPPSRPETRRPNPRWHWARQ